MVEAAHEGLGVVALPLADAVRLHQRGVGAAGVAGAARPPGGGRPVPGGRRAARVARQERADPAVAQDAVVDQEGAHPPLPAEAQPPGHAPGRPVGHAVVDVAAPPQGGGAQRAVRVEGRLDQGAGGAGDDAPAADRGVQPVADLPDAAAQLGQAHHAHQDGAARPLLAHGPGQLRAAPPPRDDDSGHEVLGVGAGVAARDGGPLLDVGVLADLGDPLDVGPGGRGQQERGRLRAAPAGGGNADLEGPHGGRS